MDGWFHTKCDFSCFVRSWGGTGRLKLVGPLPISEKLDIAFTGRVSSDKLDIARLASGFRQRGAMEENAEIELNVEEPVGECEEKKKKKRKLVGSLQILSEISNENFRSVVVRRKTLVQKRMERKTMSSTMMPPSVLRLKLQRF